MNIQKTFLPQVSPWIGNEELSNVISTLKNNWITEGPMSKEFGEKLNMLMGVKYGVLAPNGTLALFLGLLALGIGPGDEVLVPDCTFIGSANSVLLTGAKPVFVEVNGYNFQIDVNKAEGLITPQTKAIMPVHLYGMSANMREIMTFAKKYKLFVIEDAAQGIGVTYENKHVGTFGDIGCFSFFADKTITTGEGGYVVTNNEEIYKKLLLLRNQGRYNRGSFVHPAVGYNFRITDMQAAVGVAQLEKLPQIINRKFEIYSQYLKYLQGLKSLHFLKIEEGSNIIPFRFIIFVQDAGAIMKFLDERGIQSRSFFFPMHQQPCFNFLDSRNGGNQSFDDYNYSNSIYGYEHGVCLPIYPSLTDEDVNFICENIREFILNE